ncbi:MAG: hypothetical protein HZA93_25915 [Verrucomicrobia bacterium]|nr:hypothetical protein [Verrucomicrobiota bacterium]
MAALLTGAALAQTINFDTAKTGEVPAGWTATKTGSGTPKWTVEPDATAPSKPNVLKQSGEATYPLCLHAGTALRDGFVEVKFKSVSGKTDQAAGVVWRAQDADNYYVCRANALEGNVVLYKTEKGRRSSLDITGRKGGYGVDVPVAKAQWHTLRVAFAGKKFTVFFGGKKLFDVEDGTFTGAGQVGVWTKSDSVMLFDDFSSGAP